MKPVTIVLMASLTALAAAALPSVAEHPTDRVADEVNSVEGLGFVNRPYDVLTPEERELNRTYLETQLVSSDTLLVLIERLRDPRTCYLVRHALIDLGTLVVTPLREVVRDTNNSFASRTEALRVLAELGDIESAALVEPEIVPIPLGYDRERVEFQRTYLRMTLHGMTEGERLNALIEMLTEPRKHRLAREALIEMGSPAVSNLIGVLERKEHPFVSRLDALWALKEIGDVRCLPAVVRVLEDPDETDHLRELAAYSLGEIGDRSAIPVLDRVIRTWRPGPDTGVYDVAETARDAVTKIRRRIQDQ
jgi:hypothetical protein